MDVAAGAPTLPTACAALYAYRSPARGVAVAGGNGGMLFARCAITLTFFAAATPSSYAPQRRLYAMAK